MNPEKLVDISMLGPFTVTYQGHTVRESRYKDALPWQLMKYLAANYDNLREPCSAAHYQGVLCFVKNNDLLSCEKMRVKV